MSIKLMISAIIVLLFVSAGEGLVISNLYSQNTSLNSELQAINAQFSELRGSLYPMVLVDDLNRTVTLSHEPQKIVSLEPSETQIVFAIGGGSRIVGATQYDTWPADFNSSVSSGKIITVGGTLSSTINLETIVGLKQDLVLAWGLAGEETQIIQQLVNAHITVLVLAPRNLKMIYNDVLLVGRALDSYQNATIVVKNMQTIVGYISGKLDRASPVTVFYEIWNNPLITAAPTSFIGELLSLSSGSNIITNTTDEFPTVNAETVVGLNPQVIIGTNEYNMTASEIAQQPGFSDTSAAKNNRIYVLTNPALVEEPSPRVVEGILVLAQMLHPDLFGNVTVKVFNDVTGEFNSTAVQSFSA